MFSLLTFRGREFENNRYIVSIALLLNAYGLLCVIIPSLRSFLITEENVTTVLALLSLPLPLTLFWVEFRNRFSFMVFHREVISYFNIDKNHFEYCVWTGTNKDIESSEVVKHSDVYLAICGAWTLAVLTFIFMEMNLELYLSNFILFGIAISVSVIMSSRKIRRLSDYICWNY